MEAWPYVLLAAVLVIGAFAVYWILLVARVLSVYEFLINYTLFLAITRRADISLHSDYLEFQSELEKLDEQYRLLNLVVEAIDRSSGWEKIKLHKQLPKPKESRKMLDRTDALTVKWATMFRELVVEGKIEIDEGGEG